MAIQVQGNSGVVGDVAGTVFRALNVNVKPIEWGTLGHYRVNHRFAFGGTQAANSRLFEVRNTHATNLIVPTRLIIKAIQTGTFTAAIETSLDVFEGSSSRRCCHSWGDRCWRCGWHDWWYHNQGRRLNRPTSPLVPRCTTDS